MAQTFAERLKAAKNPRARLADIEALLADLQSEVVRLGEARDSAARESIDFSLSDDDRDEAAAKAGRLDRTAKALEAEIGGVAVLIEERRDSESRKALEAEKSAAIAERDELAAEFKAVVEPAVASMTSLFARVEENVARMSRAGVSQSCAEAVARGLPTFLGYGNEPARFLQMKIPAFAGHGRAWPIDHALEMSRLIYEQSRAIAIEAAWQNSPEAAAERARDAKERASEHRRTHGIYQLTTGRSGGVPTKIPLDLAEKHGLPRGVFYDEPWEGELPHAIAERLKSVDLLNVKRLDADADIASGKPVDGPDLMLPPPSGPTF